LTSNYN